MEIESWPSKTMAIEMFYDPNLWPSNSFGDWKNVVTKFICVVIKILATKFLHHWVQRTIIFSLWRWTILSTQYHNIQISFLKLHLLASYLICWSKFMKPNSNLMTTTKFKGWLNHVFTNPKALKLLSNHPLIFMVTLIKNIFISHPFNCI